MNSVQTTTETPTLRWDNRYLLLTHGIAVGLVIAWLVPPSSNWLQDLDHAVFRLLNGTLVWGPAWQRICAWSNHRIFDLVSGLTMLLILLPYLWQLRRATILLPIYTLLAMGGVIGVVRALLGELLILRILGYHRASPSLILEPCHRLSQLVPDVHAKDASPWSFPGDHGLVLFSIAIFMTSQTKAWSRWLAWGTAIMFSLPRLLSGAHWGTDLAVGSMSLALIAIGWLLGSPFLGWMQGMALRHARS